MERKTGKQTVGVVDLRLIVLRLGKDHSGGMKKEKKQSHSQVHGDAL